MERKQRITTESERKIILENLRNFNGNKPFELMRVLSSIEERAERLARQEKMDENEFREIAVIFRHFGYPVYNLHHGLQRVCAMYGEPPKWISEQHIREMYGNRQF